ncbi:hypothetical protein E4U42_007569 [Claviceps africana]|uniref:Diphthine--ammonia ligase n=1 Tax=Claviceps africana TaxID=83212 RepID=A0A8K0NG22_9HYPO|nr:hypothetical protein E4U42_007569 [Claviceps africana]
MSAERLHVIALISGGKDSFYSLLHCIHHGHRIVALANLFPVDAGHGQEDQGRQEAGLRIVLPDGDGDGDGHANDDDNDDNEPADRDLNSFMYQTVGHQVIPLYAQATGLPLYRQPILGGAVRHERDYDCHSFPSLSSSSSSSSPSADETESMLPLLRAVQAHHPEANALCSGAILSTYQRTRVESVALRLGLTPLSYLWKYPVLPPPLPHVTLADEAQLLRDMAAAGLEARIIKVASAGLEETHLWERVTSETGVRNIKAALRRFGFAQGASLGEGGEFETLVVDGPRALFKKRIRIPEHGRLAISEGGGSTWLMLRGAHLEDKVCAVPDGSEDAQVVVREPAMLDARFQILLDSLSQGGSFRLSSACPGWSTSRLGRNLSTWTDCRWDNSSSSSSSMHRSIVADSHALGTPIQCETINVVDKMRALLSSEGLDPTDMASVIVLLRDMSDFPRINEEYGKLFPRANPPSRITISCGDLLPEGHNIAVHLTVPVPVATDGEKTRNGLHVQSRSYWAPANIGPYSQAIETAVTADGKSTSLRTVYVAGQIPLMPASMTLPPSSPTVTQQQVVLSLQHLWRIGAEMKVQCWTSAVAYFARLPSKDSIRACAKLAGQAWGLAHGSPEEDEDEDGAEADGPDLWDLKYNSQHQSLGGSTESQTCSAPALPDWSIYTLQQQNEPGSCIPPVFTAEIEGLPRQSLVEWHAHAGIKNIEAGSAELIHHGGLPETGPWRSWHCVVRTNNHVLVQTTLAHVLQQEDADSDVAAATFCSSQDTLRDAYRESLRRLLPGIETSGPDAVAQEWEPYLVYVDASQTRGPEGLPTTWRDARVWERLAVVPCYSLWSAGAERLGLVALYRRILVRGRGGGM